MQSVASDKTFHLKWNNHLQNLSQLFTTIYSSSALADVTLSCRDGSIRAHKLVLSACSPYFEQIFKENPCKHPVIILKGIPYAEINLLVEFMYKGSVDVQELDLQSLMHTASELEIRGLAYEVRKDASSLLNVNLNEFPAFPTASSSGQENSYPTAFDGASAACSSPYDSTPRTVNPYQTNLERLRQIHMYQQAMCRNTPYNSSQGQATDGTAIKRKRKNDEPMPATTTTAVKNILAAAAKELAEKKNAKISTCIQTEDDVDTGNVVLEQDEEEEDDTPMHGRDTRFKGKKRVSVGMQNDFSPVVSKNKQGKAQTRVNTTAPTLTDSGDATLVTEAPAEYGTGVLKCVNLDNLRESHDDVHVLDENDDSSVLGDYTSDDNNLLVEASYDNIGQEDDYDSSDSKQDPNSKADKIFKCDLCDLSFNRSSHLARHRRTHTGERPYRCEACGRCFARGDKLKLHMRICEKDEYVLPGNTTAVVEDLHNKDTPQSMIPGMVSIGHSERHHLMFTPSGEVVLAQGAGQGQSKEPEASRSMVEVPSASALHDRLNYSDAGYPMKRGRGRPRKKPLPSVELPIVKKRRGRPPKVIKMDPLDQSRPIENYTSSNLPYGDFSYLTDIISTHFNQSTQQAYQNMMQINPILAASALTNALSNQGIPLIPPAVQNMENIKSQPPSQEKLNPPPAHSVQTQKIQPSAFTESSNEKNANLTEALKLTKEINVAQNKVKLPESSITLQETNESVKIIKLPTQTKVESVPNLNNCQGNKQPVPASEPAENNEPKQKVLMVGDCQILKISDASEGPTAGVTTVGECTIQPVTQNK